MYVGRTPDGVTNLQIRISVKGENLLVHVEDFRKDN